MADGQGSASSPEDLEDEFLLERATQPPKGMVDQPAEADDRLIVQAPAPQAADCSTVAGGRNRRRSCRGSNSSTWYAAHVF